MTKGAASGCGALCFLWCSLHHKTSIVTALSNSGDDGKQLPLRPSAQLPHRNFREHATAGKRLTVYIDELAQGDERLQVRRVIARKCGCVQSTIRNFILGKGRAPVFSARSAAAKRIEVKPNAAKKREGRRTRDLVSLDVVVDDLVHIVADR